MRDPICSGVVPRTADRPTAELSLFGLGDGGQTVFALNHDARAGENVEEFVIKADSSRKYKSCTPARSEGGLALAKARPRVPVHHCCSCR